MRKLFLATLLVACFAPAAFAQSADDYNKYDIYAGYSHNRVDVGIDDGDTDPDDIFDEREGFHGFEAAVKGNVSRYVGLKGAYTYHRRSFDFSDGIDDFDVDATAHTFLGGVEFKDNSKETKVKPFAHILAGVTNARFDVDVADTDIDDFEDSETGFAGAFGGGFDIRINDRVDFRAIQYDYAPTRLGGEVQHNFRIGVGVVFR